MVQNQVFICDKIDRFIEPVVMFTLSRTTVWGAIIDNVKVNIQGENI